MAWEIEFTDSAVKKLRKIDPPVAKRLVRFLRERVADGADPRTYGKQLKGPLSEYWRYRVGDYRLICSIEDRVMRIVVVDLAHRKNVYRGGWRSANPILSQLSVTGSRLAAKVVGGQLRDTSQPLVLTENGRAKAVVQDCEDYQ